MAKANDVKVEGKREVQRAFNQVSSDLGDMTRTNQEVATLLLPDVRAGTRRRTGALAQSWLAGADPTQAQFTNPLRYSVPQEYGYRDVEGAHAVAGAFEAKRDEIDGVYADAIRDSGKRAGLKTR